MARLPTHEIVAAIVVGSALRKDCCKVPKLVASLQEVCLRFLLQFPGSRIHGKIFWRVSVVNVHRVNLRMIIRQAYKRQVWLLFETSYFILTFRGIFELP